jgi:hypothetical protein
MSIVKHHNRTEKWKDEWLTPPELLHALGPFDLDPCAPVAAPWPTAVAHYTIHDDGLAQPWIGRVWCNPPYGLVAAAWLERCAIHGDATVLTFARTETRMFSRWVWPHAHALLFIEGRLTFCSVDGSRASANAGAPSVLIAYGEANAERLRLAEIDGAFVRLR